MIVTEAEVSQALNYLSETDEACAKAKALYDGLKDQKDTIKAIEVCAHAVAGVETVSARESLACSSYAYRTHLAKIENANADYETMRNKRTTAELKIEVWRSENANRRKGNI